MSQSWTTAEKAFINLLSLLPSEPEQDEDGKSQSKIQTLRWTSLTMNTSAPPLGTFVSCKFQTSNAAVGRGPLEPRRRGTKVRKREHWWNRTALRMIPRMMIKLILSSGHQPLGTMRTTPLPACPKHFDMLSIRVARNSWGFSPRWNYNWRKELNTTKLSNTFAPESRAPWTSFFKISCPFLTEISTNSVKCDSFRSIFLSWLPTSRQRFNLHREWLRRKFVGSCRLYPASPTREVWQKRCGRLTRTPPTDTWHARY